MNEAREPCSTRGFPWNLAGGHCNEMNASFYRARHLSAPRSITLTERYKEECSDRFDLRRHVEQIIRPSELHDERQRCPNRDQYVQNNHKYRVACNPGRVQRVHGESSQKDPQDKEQLADSGIPFNRMRPSGARCGGRIRAQLFYLSTPRTRLRDQMMPSKATKDVTKAFAIAISLM